MNQILHNDPPATQEDATLAASLLAGTQQDPDQRAALWMLLAQGAEVWAQPELRHHYVPSGEGRAALRVNWLTLAHGTSHLNTISADARAALQLACSLGDSRVLCHLGECLAVMSPVNQQRFIEMMRRAANGGAA